MEHAENVHRAPQENVQLSTFFDSLPTEVLSNILIWVHFILRDTNRKNGRLEIDGDSAEFLRDTHNLFFLIFPRVSPFRAAASSMFTNLCIHYENKTSWIDLPVGCMDIGSELFEGTMREKEVITQAFSVCGASITDIEMYRGNCEGGTGTQPGFSQIASLVVQYCRNVKELFFLDFSDPPLEWEEGRVILDEYAPQLHTIYWSNYPFRGGVQISHVLPDFSACSNIKSFQCFTIDSERMILLLQSIGEKLELLSISLEDSNGYTALLEAIQHKCTELNSISLGNSQDIVLDVGEDRYTSFICSYGDQLIKAELCGLSYENLKEIIRVCSKLELRFIELVGGIREWEYIDTIAPRLVELEITNDLLTDEDGLNAMAKCSNLRSLHIESGEDAKEFRVVEDKAMMNLFSCSSFHVLERLRLVGFNATSRNVLLIASKTSKLKHFTFKTQGIIENGNVFKQLVESNQNMSSVFVDEDSLYSEPERDFDSTLHTLQELMETFSVCKRIDISILRPQECEVGEDIVREVCGYLPCRGVELHIRVGETVYEQTDGLHGGRGLDFR